MPFTGGPVGVWPQLKRALAKQAFSCSDNPGFSLEEERLALLSQRLSDLEKRAARCRFCRPFLKETEGRRRRLR